MEKIKPKFTLEQGVFEDNTHVRCQQDKCSFFHDGHCKSCDTCGATPFILNKSCDRCTGCANEEGELRWGEKSKKQGVKQKVKVPEQIEQKPMSPVLQAMEIAVGGRR